MTLAKDLKCDALIESIHKEPHACKPLHSSVIIPMITCIYTIMGNRQYTLLQFYMFIYQDHLSEFIVLLHYTVQVAGQMASSRRSWYKVEFTVVSVTVCFSSPVAAKQIQIIFFSAQCFTVIVLISCVWCPANHGTVHDDQPLVSSAI